MELLFARGLVKVLFATETFAMVLVTLCPGKYDVDTAFIGSEYARTMRRLFSYPET